MNKFQIVPALLCLAVTTGCSLAPGDTPISSNGTPVKAVATPPGPAPKSPDMPVVTPSAAAPAKPTSSGTPGAAPSGDFGDLDKAAGQKGVDDVKKIGKNPVAADAGAADKGKALFATNCASCHGAEGKGDGPAGAALDPKPRNLHENGTYKFGSGDLAMFRTIKYGVDGSGMAPWEGRMTDDECWQVVNFVKTLHGK